MTVDTLIYGNLILTAIAVILLLIFITNIFILLHLKKEAPAKIKKEEKKEKISEVKTKKEEKAQPSEKITDPSKLYKAESIEKNLIELFGHYNLNSFTMATSDGLVISSTDPDAEEDAASYSYLYLQGKQPESLNVRLIGVPHKGGTVVGIIKSDDELSENSLALIERDIKYILRRNI